MEIRSCLLRCSALLLGEQHANTKSKSAPEIKASEMAPKGQRAFLGGWGRRWACEEYWCTSSISYRMLWTNALDQFIALDLGCVCVCPFMRILPEGYSKTHSHLLQQATGHTTETQTWSPHSRALLHSTKVWLCPKGKMNHISKAHTLKPADFQDTPTQTSRFMNQRRGTSSWTCWMNIFQ